MTQLNEEILAGIVERYKEALPRLRSKSLSKWEAVKQFQIAWDPNAENIPVMLDEALSQSGALLTGFKYYPKLMLIEFAKCNPKKTLNALLNLFDESNNLENRLKEFESAARLLLNELNKDKSEQGEGPANNHYQDTRAASAYLAFRFPEKNYLYKSSMYRAFSEQMNIPLEKDKYKKPAAFKEICDGVLEYLKLKAPEVIELSDSFLSNELRSADPEYHLLVQDILYFVEQDDEQIEDYFIEKDAVLQNKNCIHYWLYTPGSSAEKWEEFYKSGIMGLMWPVLGDYRKYKTKDQVRSKLQSLYSDDSSHKNQVHAIWQFAHELKPGDIVFAKRGNSQILGRGIVLSDYEYDDSLADYPNIRKIEWTHKGSWKYEANFATKVLTDVTAWPDFVEQIESMVLENKPDMEEVTERPDLKPYTDADFLDQVYIDAEELATLKTLLRRKKNLILQGSPGTGKTFLSKRLAYSMMGEVDPKRIEMVQFHQSSTYDEFVIGYRPTENGSFKAQPGIFVRFCNKADADSDHDYFFIIDEINRANISKVFGELLMLIESDHRGETVSLSVEGYDFKVPDNVYIIGMMNTADRGLALIDYALRRRFAFYEMKPAFENINFQSKLVDNERLVALSNAIVELNKRITEDPALGRGFCIGHSYFCGNDLSDKDADLILNYELIPLLEEYWFDDPDKVTNEVTLLKAAIS